MTNVHTIKTTANISASHTLKDHTGDCRNLHGHNYKVDVSITTRRLQDDGMLIDFGDVKRILMRYDHAFICNLDNQFDVDLSDVCTQHGAKVVYVNKNTTAENLSKLFAEEIMLNLDTSIVDEFTRIDVHVWETDKHCSSYYLTGE
jgi:6-pyruvoyltetrahydropterin/6-carboxytetrahydropterin synthase